MTQTAPSGPLPAAGPCSQSWPMRPHWGSVSSPAARVRTGPTSQCHSPWQVPEERVALRSPGLLRRHRSSYSTSAWRCSRFCCLKLEGGYSQVLAPPLRGSPAPPPRPSHGFPAPGGQRREGRKDIHAEVHGFRGSRRPRGLHSHIDELGLPPHQQMLLVDELEPVHQHVILAALWKPEAH